MIIRHAGSGLIVALFACGLVAAQDNAPLLLRGGARRLTTAEGHESAPFFSPDGSWDVQNRGVAPDIEVELDPAAWRRGGDPQLERAVGVVSCLLVLQIPLPVV